MREKKCGRGYGGGDRLLAQASLSFARDLSVSVLIFCVFSQFKERADKTNKSLLRAASFLSTNIKLFHGSRFVFWLQRITETSFSICIDFSWLFPLDKYRQGHAKWSPAPSIQPKHWGAAGKFDYAYITKIPNGLSLSAPHSQTLQLYCRGLNGL